MCEVKVFKQQGGEEVLLLKDVYLIEQEEKGLRFETIFGEQKVYEAEIESVSLADNKVVIREKYATDVTGFGLRVSD
jgi:predicted RNA-binding protein